MAPTFLLFSGHNERAVVTLCRYFTAAGLPFVIASAGADDAIHRTAYASRVVFERTDRAVDVGLFAHLAQGHGGALTYCPTTEFINDFVLRHRSVLAATGLRIGLPPRGVYELLTGKESSPAALAGVPGLRQIPCMPVSDARAPCVLKPVQNVQGGRVDYPLLCPDAKALDEARAQIDVSRYFAQPFVRGQSFYFCAYLGTDGGHVGYWQENLLQQPGGKSIVLARTCANPGLDEAALCRRLAALGFHGPFMMELIGNADGLHYIEINPRFWGPLQLALDACPELLHRYAEGEGATVARTPAAAIEGCYAWAFGARAEGLQRYPAARSLPDADRLLREHDIYNRPDTAALAGCH